MPEATQMILLAPRELHAIADAAGVRLTCRSGAVWITVDGDAQDYVLEAGETFAESRHARLLLYALGTARIDVVECHSRKETMATLSRFQAMPLMKAAR
jgi:hypothetical protein